MPIHVEEVTSDISAEAPAAASNAAPAPEWQELARMRELHGQVLRDASRIASEGFDD